MKKLLVLLVTALFAVTGVAATGCNQGGEKNIMVICREASSGTREAFEDNVEKDGVSLADALENDSVSLVNTALFGESTGAVISNVAANDTAIGYASLAALNDTVKAINVEGVEATAENVRSGDYDIQRPFLLLTRADEVMTPAARDFYNFCMSSDAFEFIDDHGVRTNDSSSRPAYSTAADTISGTIFVEGSTSMEDLMNAIIGAYRELQPDVTITPEFNGSSFGRSAVAEDTTGATIGLASSSSPNANYVENTICLDAVAIIVNPSNEIENVTLAQLFDIFTGSITKFSELN